jgi:hypothetical protein
MNMQYDFVPTTCHSYSDITSLNVTMDKNGNPNIHITFIGLWDVTLKGTAAYEFDRTRCRC